MKLAKWRILTTICGLGLVFIVWQNVPLPGITEKNALLIRRGMTMQQVEKILLAQAGRALRGRMSYIWRKKDLIVSVSFSEAQMTVDGACFFNVRGDRSEFIPMKTETVVDKIRNWLSRIK